MNACEGVTFVLWLAPHHTPLISSNSNWCTATWKITKMMGVMCFNLQEMSLVLIFRKCHFIPRTRDIHFLPWVSFQNISTLVQFSILPDRIAKRLGSGTERHLSYHCLRDLKVGVLFVEQERYRWNRFPVLSVPVSNTLWRSTNWYKLAR